MEADVEIPEPGLEFLKAPADGRQHLGSDTRRLRRRGAGRCQPGALHNHLTAGRFQNQIRNNRRRSPAKILDACPGVCPRQNPAPGCPPIIQQQSHPGCKRDRRGQTVPGNHGTPGVPCSVQRQHLQRRCVRTRGDHLRRSIYPRRNCANQHGPKQRCRHQHRSPPGCCRGMWRSRRNNRRPHTDRRFHRFDSSALSAVPSYNRQRLHCEHRFHQRQGCFAAVTLRMHGHLQIAKLIRLHRQCNFAWKSALMEFCLIARHCQVLAGMSGEPTQQEPAGHLLLRPQAFQQRTQIRLVAARQKKGGSTGMITLDGNPLQHGTDSSRANSQQDSTNPDPAQPIAGPGDFKSNRLKNCGCEADFQPPVGGFPEKGFATGGRWLSGRHTSHQNGH